MEQSIKNLIQDLSKDYGPRPWWKNPRTLFLIWFVSHIAYFLSLGLMKSEAIILRPSLLFVILEVSGGVFTFALFIYLSRHPELKTSWMKTSLGLAILWIAGSVVIENSFMGTILHERSFSVTSGDFSCFWHTTISTIGPLLLFPLVFRNFFFARPLSAMTLMTFHLAFLGLILNELKCADREFWHLLMGHQTSVIGIGLLMLGITFVARKQFSSKLSVREK